MPDLIEHSGEKYELAVPNPLAERVNSIRTLWDRGKLSFYLLRDPRVSYAVKAIPVLALAYIISPVDLLPAAIAGPLGLIDDVTLALLAINWFIDMSPAEVVAEYATQLGLIKGG